MSLIEVPFSVQQIPKSKYVTVQVEIKTSAYAIDIRNVLGNVHRSREKADMSHPHQAVFLADVIESMKAFMINFKIKKDSPVQLEFSVSNGVFLMSISF